MERRELLAEHSAMFQDFQWRWREGKSIEGHPVWFMVRALAKQVAWECNCPYQADDLMQEGLLCLGTEGRYEGKASLNAYIKQILISKVRVVNKPLVRQPRKSHKKGEPGEGGGEPSNENDKPAEDRHGPRYVRLDDVTEGLRKGQIRPATLNLEAEVLTLMSSERFMREVLERLPELERTIINIIIEYEGDRPKNGEIKKAAEEVLQHEISRYRFEITMKKLAVIIAAWFWPA